MKIKSIFMIGLILTGTCLWGVEDVTSISREESVGTVPLA